MELAPDHLPDPGQALLPLGKAYLPAPDGGDGAKAATPYPPLRKSAPVRKQNLDLVLKGQQDGIRTQMGALSHTDAAEFQRRKQLFPVGVHHPEHILVAQQ